MSLSLPTAWRGSSRAALFFWAVCTLLSGHFAKAGGIVLPLTYLAVSLIFWLGFYAFALRHTAPSIPVTMLVSLAPLLLFGGTLFCWISLWSR